MKIIYILAVSLVATACSAAEGDPFATNTAAGSDTAASRSTPEQRQTAFDEQARIGRCHGGVCSWSIEQSRATVEKESSGTLLKITLIGGESSHPDGEYDLRQRIIWNREPHEVFVFCSKAFPALIVEQEDGFVVESFDFSGSVPAYKQANASLYAQTCHGNRADWSAEGFALNFGYSATETDNFKVSQPQEIFKRLRSVSRQDQTSAGSMPLEPLSENMLSSDPDAIYGYTCRVNDARQQLILFTTDPTAANQTVDATAQFQGKKLRLQGDRNIDRNGRMRLRDGETSIVVEAEGELIASGDAGDQADGRGTLSIMPSSGPPIKVTISCIEM